MRTNNGILPRLMKICSVEITSISDYLYYALMLEEKYPDLAEFFDNAAIIEMEIFKCVSRLLLSLGRDPYIERAVGRAVGVGHERKSVEGIIKSVCRKIELDIVEYERILASWGEESGRDLLFEIIDKKKMLIDSFEMVLNS